MLCITTTKTPTKKCNNPITAYCSAVAYQHPKNIFLCYIFLPKNTCQFQKIVYFCIEINCNFYLIVNYGD